MNNPKISIIIPVYGVEEQIKKCARSLFEQTLKEIEFIFINDCTPDNSILELKKIIDEYPHRKEDVILINHQQNKGLSTTRLTGLHLAKGEYIGHCDSDDWIEPDMYELMLDKAIKEEADIVCAGLFYEGDNKVKVDTFCSNISSMTKVDYLSKIPLGGKYSSLCNKLIKRELYFSNRIFPIPGISMWEDMVVTYRLIYYSKKIAIISRPLYHYVLKENSITSSNSFSKKHAEEQIKCSRIIEDFLKKEGKIENENYKVSIQFLKFMSKLSYLLNKKTRNLELWRHTFQESHKYIMQFNELSFFRRISYKLAVMAPKLFVLIKDIYSFAKENKNKVSSMADKL